MTSIQKPPNHNGFIYLLKSIKGKNHSEITIKLANSPLIDSEQKYVNFMTYIDSIHFSSSDDKLIILQSLLTICPSNVLYLFISVCNVSSRLLLLKNNTDILMKYVIEQIKEGKQDTILELLRELQERELQEPFQDYYETVSLFLEIQLRNPELETEVRYKIFKFIGGNKQLVMIVVQNNHKNDSKPTMRQVNDWIRRVSSELGFPITFLWYSKINVKAVVKAMFPIIKSPDPEHICPICQSKSTDSDKCNCTWRKLPCCGQQQCHKCLDRQVRVSNTYDVFNPSKRTDQMSCSLCRGIILFPDTK